MERDMAECENCIRLRAEVDRLKAQLRGIFKPVDYKIDSPFSKPAHPKQEGS